MTLLDVGKLALIATTPTLLGVLVICGPRWWEHLSERWPRRDDSGPRPAGPPIQQLAADLRRLLRLHAELTDSAHLAMRAHRLWAVEAAIEVRATEAAQALDVHRDPARSPQRADLCALLRELSDAGMVLPAKIGPFVGEVRY